MSQFKQIVSPKKYEQLEDTKKDVELANDEPSVSSPALPSNPPLSILRLVLLTIPFIGIQFCWAIQSGYSTSTFLQLGMPKTVVSYAWLAGPVSGIVIQPLVGEYSDRSTSRWGRRRPYIVVGAVLVIVSLMIFGISSKLEGSASGLGLGLAVASFWVHDMAINAMQGPARSLLPDIVPSEQLYLGNALIALMTGFGSLAGNFLGSVELDKIFTFSSSQVQLLYTIGAVVVVITVSTGVFSTKEVPPSKQRQNEETDSLVGVVPATGARSDAIVTTLEAEPPSSYSIDDEAPLSTPQVVEIPVKLPTSDRYLRFNWFGWFCLYIYGSVWVAVNIYHGVADSGVKEEQERFDAGIRTANLGLALQAVVAIVAAPVFPWIIRVVGLKWVYLAGQLVFAGCLMSALVISTPVWAVVMLALLGIPCTCAATIPWSVTIMALDADQLARTGLLMATMNLSIVVSFISSGLLVAWGSFGYAGVLATGGIFALVGAVLIVKFVK